jgi:hypothetical protein
MPQTKNYLLHLQNQRYIDIFMSQRERGGERERVRGRARATAREREERRETRGERIKVRDIKLQTMPLNLYRPGKHTFGKSALI